MTKPIAYCFILLSLVSSGCLSKQVARDGIGTRQAILDLYTDQVMDNLIRGKTGHPFVQLSYRDILIQDSDSLSGTLDNGYTAGTTRTSSAVGAITGVVRNFSNVLRGTATGKRDRTISFKADPITDKNDIYELYLAFALDPTLFCESDTKPVCPVHIMKKCGKRYYWVPCDAAGVFQQLCLRTTFMRGAEKPAGPDYFSATIKELIKEKEEAGVFYGYVVFDHGIPSDDGTIVATLDDKRKVKLRISPLTKPVGGVIPVRNGTETTTFEINWDTKARGFTDVNLRGASVRIYLQNNFPPPPPTTPDLQRINDNLDQIRLNILNQNINLNRP